jgi:hypothetical protein
MGTLLLTLVLQDMEDEVTPLSAARAFVSSNAHNGWLIQYSEFPDAGYGEAGTATPNDAKLL